jgi:hypothetical protein
MMGDLTPQPPLLCRSKGEGENEDGPFSLLLPLSIAMLAMGRGLGGEVPQ